MFTSSMLVRFRRASLAALTSLVAIPCSAPLVAQGTSLQIVASTGLHTLAVRHTMRVRLVEVGEAEPIEVELRLLDPEDRVVRSVRGVLAAGDPVQLSLQGPPQGARALRAEAVLVTTRSNLGTAPVLTVEVVNQQTLDSFTTTSCAIPYDPKGTSGEVLASCGGCHFFIE